MGVAEGSAPESYVIALLAEGRHQAAFDAIAEFGPSQAYAPHFANLGYRLWRAGRADDATQALERALHLDPTYASPWLTLAMLKLSQQQLQEGARALDEALARDPQMAAAHYLQAVVAKRSGHTDDAVAGFAACLEIHPGHREAAEELRGLLSGPGRDASLRQRARQALKSAEASRERSPARATLSLCLIVKDEADSLPRCLRTFRPVADQIVVVDTGSTDATHEVAAEHGAEVYPFEWIDDFAAARNAALARATCDWILIADADEELPPESADQLRELLAGDLPASVYQLITHAPSGSPGAPCSDLVAHPRLLRNRRGLHFAGAIHEQLVDREGHLLKEVVFTGIPVLHHGYRESSSAMQERSDRNLRLLSARAQSEPDNPSVLFYLGMAQAAAGQIEEAVLSFQQVLQAERELPFRAKTVVFLARALTLLDRAIEAEQLLRCTLEELPKHPELLCALADLLRQQHRVEEAAEAYRSAARGRFGPSLDYHDFTCRDALPRGRLAEIHLARGQAQTALDEVAAALAIRPENPHLRHLRACARLSLGQTQEARGELEDLVAEHPQHADAHNSLGVVLALAREYEPALHEFERALSLRPDDVDTLCNLAMACHALGHFERSRNSYEAALKRNPSHVPAWLGLARTYLDTDAYQSGAHCYEMAAEHSGYDPEVMAEIAAARVALSEIRQCHKSSGGA